MSVSRRDFLRKAVVTAGIAAITPAQLLKAEPVRYVVPKGIVPSHLLVGTNQDQPCKFVPVWLGDRKHYVPVW